MISEVNVALRDLLKPVLPGRTAVNFTLPAEGDQSFKGISLFLYGICGENTGGTAWSDVRDEAGNLIGRKPPVRRYRLSYLVTAWAADSEREIGLLDQALSAFTGWEDARLAQGPGAAATADDRVLLGMEVASVGPEGELWEVLKAAHVVARPVFGLVATTSVVHELLTELAPTPQRIDLQPSMGKPPGQSLAQAASSWKQEGAVAIERRESADETASTSGASATAGKTKTKGKVQEAGAGEERMVKTWQRMRVNNDTKGNK